MNTHHPVARIFGPMVFVSLALLALGMSFSPSQAEQSASLATAPVAQARPGP